MNTWLSFLLIVLSSCSMVTCNNQFNVNVQLKLGSLKQPINIIQVAQLDFTTLTWSLGVGDYIFEIKQLDEKEHEVTLKLKVLLNSKNIAEEIITIPRGGQAITLEHETKTESRYFFLPFLKSNEDKIEAFKFSVSVS